MLRRFIHAVISSASRLLLLLLVTNACVAQDASPPPVAQEATPPAAPEVVNDHPVESWLEAQVELHRRGFSCGEIDGERGPQTVAALRAFQRARGIATTGKLDEATCSRLQLTAPVFTTHTFAREELAELRALPATWLGKSEAPFLAYETALELVAEHYRASPVLIRRLNPDIDWDGTGAGVQAGMSVKVPDVELTTIAGKVVLLTINLTARELEGIDELGRVIAHFPVSIAKMVEKRPVGELRVKVIVPDPNYTFDPEVFPESAEGRELGRKLVIPPGPNNPVGRAWIGLDLPGYGIHGTPSPENVGRTESHGCFRLANWDALTLLGIAQVGMKVLIEP